MRGPYKAILNKSAAILLQESEIKFSSKHTRHSDIGDVCVCVCVCLSISLHSWNEPWTVKLCEKRRLFRDSEMKRNPLSKWKIFQLVERAQNPGQMPETPILLVGGCGRQDVETGFVQN